MEAPLQQEEENPQEQEGSEEDHYSPSLLSHPPPGHHHRHQLGPDFDEVMIEDEEEEDQPESSELLLVDDDDDDDDVPLAPLVVTTASPPQHQQGDKKEDAFLAKLTWSDVEFDPEDKVAKKIMGRQAMTYKSNELRKICSHLKVKLVRNPNKKEMVQHLFSYFKGKQDVINIAQQDKTSRKGPQCGYRLMNILFSDRMAGQFARIGDVADKATLDKGMAINNEQFWVEVQTIFTQKPGDEALADPTINVLHFKEDDVFCNEEDNNVDMSAILDHSWKKLLLIWKAILREYKAIKARYTLSGSHDPSFYNFCHGNKEAYYLHLHLNKKPELAGTVNADLPAETFKEAGCTHRHQEQDAANNDALTTPSPSRQKKKRRTNSSARSTPEGGSQSPNQEDNIVMLVRAIGNLSKSRHDVASADREAAKAAQREQNESCRLNRLQEKQFIDAENARRQQESKETSRRNLMSEWEQLSNNCRRLRQDLTDQTMDVDTRESIRSDLQWLEERKRDVRARLSEL